MADLTDPNTWFALAGLAISFFAVYVARATFKRQFPGRLERLESRMQALDDKVTAALQSDTQEAALIAVDLRAIKGQMATTISSIDHLTQRIDDLYARKK